LETFLRISASSNARFSGSHRKVKIVRESLLTEAAKKVGMMKRAVAVLLMIIVAVLLQHGLAFDSIGSVGFTGSGVSILSPGSDIKRMQERFSEALAALNISQSGQADEESARESPDQARNASASVGGSPDNSSLQNDSINSSIESSPSSPPNPDQINASSTGSQSVGSSSQGGFKGFYGMTASRHEIGKSGIDSSMFLSGDFEMDKSVKFQDQGF
jgi:hypothetical protein